MKWTHVWTLYRRELRSALRERSIVVNSLLLPVFLYPVILWLTFSGITFVQGLSEGYVSRVALFGVPADRVELADSLRARDDVSIVDSLSSRARAETALGAEALDAVVTFEPAGGDAGALPGNVRIRIAYDRSESRSERAYRRVEGVVERYRGRWAERLGRELGLSEAERARFRIESRNISTGSEMGAFVLAEMIPVFLVIMVALGCFVPAIDATAGERERSTWETLMTVSASRGAIVASKYLYVATLGTCAGVLNILAMTASMGAVLGPVLGGRAPGMEFEYPATAVPVMVLGAVILALFFAATMMILASFARTFKDGQSMVTPIYWLALVPLFLSRAPDQHLTPELALVPIVNVVLMIRDAIQGVLPWLLIAESFAVGLVLVAACLWVARWILSFEEVLMGSYDGSFWRFVKERVGREGTA